ncbi:energizing coupling factor of ABC influx transporter (ATP-binding protein) [Petrocella atlantisensis]|uniref:Energy-coupling factor transporter ATP-binding protein EcfA2 n=1 Tax=Petrocella atlantisensis TaxID=2173034 RepID=A0A3P7S172_9FIRM|nr:energy-coupling factor transporter ATPase [Petrocella atlantisensis]MCF8019148.1 energy-coupling factor transporter ATPase [Vallitaleaceae bacterium]VDN48606.1 energizing coupling factor of ABC influx transporter (ATP-binding protein) [Petrocella atlantisensis]
MSITIENLNYTYGVDTAFRMQALKQINLTIKPGEFVGLIGHTGSGKSTLIQQINGILKPDSGSVIIGDISIFDKGVDLKSIRQKVGLVFQYPEHQLFEMTVFKDVAFGPTNMKLEEDEIKKRVKHALDIVGIDETLYESSPFDLSGGQKRRVAIAGVLAMMPKILILDEPTAGLDPQGRYEILNEIQNLHKSLGITVILVSHSMEDIARYVERVVVMDKGEIKMDGVVKEIFKETEALEAMGLAVPQVSYLIQALNKHGFNLSADIVTLEEAKDALITLLKK